jgi:serine/threonine-protein kinase
MARAWGVAAVSDIFVSYKAEDQRRVRPLVDALEVDGLSVWWDAEIGGGAAWRQSIEAELDAARCVIVIWSKRSAGPDGTFVHDEASRAMERRVYLPVKIDNVRPPLGFGERQALSLARWQGNRADPRYQALLHAARAIMEGKAPRMQVAVAGPGIDRRAILAGGAVAAVAAGAGAWYWLHPSSSTAANSIAVLPFANLSGDPAQAYFSDGIAEELRTALSRIAGLKVVARTSSEAMRDADAKTAAQKLGVSNILTGSVRRSPSTIRVTAQLIDGPNGLERWTENYDRPAGDALQIQTDIANRVADALSIRLGGSDRKRILEGGTDNSEAHDLLLKAEASIQQGEGREVWERAVGMLDAALALDPHYADALASKSRVLKGIAGSLSQTAEESQRLYAAAEAAARQAIKIAPQLKAGYGVLGDILYEQLHARAALAEYQRMLAAPGDDVSALRGYAVFLAESKRIDEALGLIDGIVAIDPLNANTFSWKAYIQAAGRRYPDAIESIRQLMKLVPNRSQPRSRLGYYLMMQGRYDEARAAMESGGIVNAIDRVYRAVLSIRTGNRQAAEQALASMRGKSYAYFQVAQLLTQLGRNDEAIAALESAWNNRDSGLTTVLIDPLLDPLRGDPRFEEIVKRIDFPTQFSGV